MAKRARKVIAGRPTPSPSNPITPELWDEVLELIEQGHTIRDISAMADMPNWTTIRRFIRADDAHRTQYARAREVAADAYEAQIIDHLNAADPETAAACRVKIDALKWLMSKRAPKVYGDKVTQELTGVDGAPLQMPTLVIAPFQSRDEPDEN